MRRLPHYLLAATLVAGAPLAALAVTPSTSPDTSAAAALPTSWTSVPVADRLQPWLAGTLATADPAKPLRVMVSGETTAAARGAATAAGLTVQQTWPKAGIVVALGTPAQVRDVVARDGVTAVQGDMPLAYTLDTAHTATRSDEAMTTYTAPDGSPVDGSGMSIAVIDSGIDGTHPMFTKDGASKVVRNLKAVCGAPSIVAIFTGEQFSDVCFQHVPTNDTDTISGGGHGTHVAGIAAGYEVTPADGPTLRGAAPGANLVGLSVGAAIGLIDANSAINWVVEHQRRPCAPATEQDGPIDPACPPIKVTNHSYGPATPAPEGTEYEGEDGPTVRLLRLLVTQGVVPVWAAGNAGGNGTFAQTNPPAMDATPGVLMVASYNDGGAGNRDNALSSFSSRGKEGDPTTYPDLSAPGDLITSACRPTLAVCQGAPSYDGGNYQTISGTSMASPYVAGVVAQLFEADPALTPGAVEDVLEDTAYKFTAGGAYESDPRNPDDTTSFDKGHGLVDVLAALARVQGLPEPGATTSTPLCTSASPQVVDAEGDAYQVVLVDTPTPSQPSLDIRKAWLTWDDAAQALTFHIAVTDLSAGPPAGSVGEFLRFYVTKGSDAEVYVVANRDVAGETFFLRQYDTSASQAVTGTFDEATNEISVVVPEATYAQVIPGGSLAIGDAVSAGQVLGQRDTNAVTITTDTAAGSCPYTVGAEDATPDPDPEPTETATPTPTPTPVCKGKSDKGKGNNCTAG